MVFMCILCMKKHISLEQFQKLGDDFFHQVRRVDRYDGKLEFVAYTPDEFVLDGLMLKYAKTEYDEAVSEIKSAQEWIAERKEKGLGYDKEAMRKAINAYRSRKSRAKQRVLQENKKFETELAWCIVYPEL